jgi:hypothetical protein
VYVKRTRYSTAIGDTPQVTERKLAIFAQFFYNNSSLSLTESELYADCLRSIKNQPDIEHEFYKEWGSMILIDSAPTAELLHDFYVSCLGEDLYAKTIRLSNEIAAKCDLKVTITEEFI